MGQTYHLQQLISILYAIGRRTLSRTRILGVKVPYFTIKLCVYNRRTQWLNTAKGTPSTLVDEIF